MVNNRLNKDVVFDTDVDSYILNNQSGILRASKYTEVCVLPYTMQDNDTLDKIGVVYYNTLSNARMCTLLHGYRAVSDASCMLTANRIMFDVIGINVDKAEKWMFLGDMYDRYTSTPIKVYCVDVTDDIKLIEDDATHLKFVEVGYASKSDDTILLSSIMRLFNLYINHNISLK
ncbi:MAG: hypothetical protein ACRDD8_14210 [Bacteroidales bacterium]